MHGYLIQTILNAAIGPFRRLSWGTLYPMLSRLEKDGYIEPIETGKADPRGKKRYRTTEAGRTRFLEMMGETGRYDAGYRDLFRLKLGCFGSVGEDIRLRILQDNRAYLVQLLEYTTSMVNRIEQDSAVVPDEKRFALLGLEHQQRLAYSEVEWVDFQINKQIAGVAQAKRPRTKRKG